MVLLASRDASTRSPSSPPPGSIMGLHHECPGPVHVPVSGRHWWEAGQEDKQQLSSGGALRPRLRRSLHRCFTATYYSLLSFIWRGSAISWTRYSLFVCLLYLSSFSLCCCGNMHFMWNRKILTLDVLLRVHRDVHVLLRPLADLRVRDPPLWPVSPTFSRFLQ